MNPSQAAEAITEDEAALYDRQIRLWGLDAQTRLRNARILVIGGGALANETCKNLVLAGVGSLTIWDDAIVSAQELPGHFYLGDADVGRPRVDAMLPHLQRLNPRVKIHTHQVNLKDMTDNDIACTSTIILTSPSLHDINRVNRISRAHNIQLLAADAPGLFGYIFIDIGQHTYVEEKNSPSTPGEKMKVSLVEDYVTLERALRAQWSGVSLRRLRRHISPLWFALHLVWLFQLEHLALPTPENLNEVKAPRPAMAKAAGVPEAFIADAIIDDLLASLCCEFSPTCAIVGGILAQEVIKIITHKDLPVSNVYLYNGKDGSGHVHRIIPTLAP